MLIQGWTRIFLLQKHKRQYFDLLYKFFRLQRALRLFINRLLYKNYLKSLRIESESFQITNKKFIFLKQTDNKKESNIYNFSYRYRDVKNIVKRDFENKLHDDKTLSFQKNNIPNTKYNGNNPDISSTNKTQKLPNFKWSNFNVCSEGKNKLVESFSIFGIYNIEHIILIQAHVRRFLFYLKYLKLSAKSDKNLLRRMTIQPKIQTCLFRKVLVKNTILNKIKLIQSYARKIIAKNKIFGLKKPLVKFGIIKKDIKEFLIPCEKDFIASRKLTIHNIHSNNFSIINKKVEYNNASWTKSKNNNQINQIDSHYTDKNHKLFVNINRSLIYQEDNNGGSSNINNINNTSSKKNKSIRKKILNDYPIKKLINHENAVCIINDRNIKNNSTENDMNHPKIKCIKIDYENLSKQNNSQLNTNNKPNFNYLDAVNPRKSSDADIRNIYSASKKIIAREINCFRKKRIDKSSIRKIIKIQSLMRSFLFLIRYNRKKNNLRNKLYKIFAKDRFKHNNLMYHFKKWLRLIFGKKVR